MITEKEWTGTINEPVPFGGTRMEAEANFATHSFGYSGDDLDARCLYCDSKVWHKSATYPCGSDVPRQVRVFFSDDTEVIMTEADFQIFMESQQKI